LYSATFSNVPWVPAVVGFTAIAGIPAVVDFSAVAGLSDC
jgi:hypothetical protein